MEALQSPPHPGRAPPPAPSELPLLEVLQTHPGLKLRDPFRPEPAPPMQIHGYAKVRKCPVIISIFPRLFLVLCV